ncbi:MAG: hypothetical protein OXH98_14450 [Caldilineaceae bacterium]|nr:hypothetical protein [Caldilineaceae bacterium]
MKTVANILVGMLGGIVIIVVFLTIRNLPQESPPTGDAANVPLATIAFPTWTTTPIPPTPTNTPSVPTATFTPRPSPTPVPLPTEKPSWNQLLIVAEIIPYDDLMRYHRNHENKLVYFKAIVAQYQGDETLSYIVAADYESEYYDPDVLYLVYENAPIRVLEHDFIEVIARFRGLHTYSAIHDRPITALLLEVVELKILDQ